ncbi:riboflavin synthase subunit alpha [Anaerosporomusa subterranea]|uniref:Riboflavin synthase n=1 Tax=Anaerosporomusa subterranea TaxID=1794912 RepID=A0A154BTG6_ANASB|nr:riboflavin synthase [Anaerosporomusa subterranea]KYZ77197.1 riboflavin synthase subunit alpha [Anaerosporomusa subterranea]
MFTGIVEELGTVKSVMTSRQSAKLSITADITLQNVKLGDSIAVNGVCLTVTEHGRNWFSADVMPETMNRTALGDLTNGRKVNLERALRLSDRLGGHIVSGHIDGVGIIQSKQPLDNAILITLQTDSRLLRYVVNKGSVALDGISLTVVDCGKDWLSVSIIPHTLSATTLHFKSVGDKVNIETDMMAKYAEKLLDLAQSADVQTKSETLSRNFLAAHGFFD